MLRWLMSRFTGYVGRDQFPRRANSPPANAALTPRAARDRRARPPLSRRRRLGAHHRARPGAQANIALRHGRCGDRRRSEARGDRRGARAARGAGAPEAASPSASPAGCRPASIASRASPRRWRGAASRSCRSAPPARTAQARRRPEQRHDRPRSIAPASGHAAQQARGSSSSAGAPTRTSPSMSRPATNGRCRRAASTRRGRRYDAALRELYEETSVTSVVAHRRSARLVRLRSARRRFAESAWKGRYRGQTAEMVRAALRRRRQRNPHPSSAPAAIRPEFDAWRWERMDRLPELIIPFKRPVYEKVVRRSANTPGRDTTLARTRCPPQANRRGMTSTIAPISGNASTAHRTGRARAPTNTVARW